MSKAKNKPVAAPAKGGHGVLVGRPEWWGQYILHLIECGTPAHAARRAGTTKQNAAQVIAANPDLAEEAAEAAEIRQGVLREVMGRIATEGIRLPTYAADNTTVIGYETKWDARVLLKLAESILPECRAKPDATPDRSPQGLTEQQILQAIAAGIRAFSAFQGLPGSPPARESIGDRVG